MPTQQDLIAALTARLAQPQREQMPWERGTTTPIFDMFGSLQDDPVLRRARELQHDEAIADETYKAQYGEYPENFPPNVLAASVMSNQGRRSAPSAGSGYVKSGSTVLQRNPVTGELDVAYEPPNPFDARAANDLSKDRRAKLKNDLENYQTAYLKLDPESPSYDDDRRTILRNLVRLETEWNNLTANDPMKSTPARPVAKSPANYSFIGEPEGWESPVSTSRNWDRPTGVNYSYEEGRYGQPESPFERGLKMGGGGSAAPAKKRLRFDPTTGTIK